MHMIRESPLPLFVILIIALSTWFGENLVSQETESNPQSASDHFLRFVGKLMDQGWFGTAEAATGEEVGLSDSQDLVLATHRFTSQKGSPRITSFVLTKSEKIPLLRYSLVDDGRIRLHFREGDSEGSLHQNLLKFVRMIAFLQNYRDVEELKLHVKNKAMSEEAAVEKLMKYDFQVLKEVQDFGKTYWVGFCETHDIQDRHYEDWQLEGDLLTDFKSFSSSTYGVELKAHTQKTVSGWK